MSKDTKPAWKTTEATFATLAGGSVVMLATDATDPYTKGAACIALALMAVAWFRYRTEAKS